MGAGLKPLGIAGAGAREAVVNPLSSAELCSVPSSSAEPGCAACCFRQWVAADTVARWWLGVRVMTVRGVEGVSRYIKEGVLICCTCQEVILPFQLGTEGVPEMPLSGQFSAGTLFSSCRYKRHCLGLGQRKGQWSSSAHIGKQAWFLDRGEYLTWSHLYVPPSLDRKIHSRVRRARQRSQPPRKCSESFYPFFWSDYENFPNLDTREEKPILPWARALVSGWG